MVSFVVCGRLCWCFVAFYQRGQAGFVEGVETAALQARVAVLVLDFYCFLPAPLVLCLSSGRGPGSLEHARGHSPALLSDLGGEGAPKKARQADGDGHSWSCNRMQNTGFFKRPLASCLDLSKYLE